MAISNLKIIGESINDSIPSTQKLFNEENIQGIVDLAKSQDEKGAAYIDVNVGRRSPSFMADLVKRIQAVTAKPLSIDTPDMEIAEAGLRAYDKGRTGGKMPVLNSISPLRLNLFDLYKVQPFIPILMVSEKVENGASSPNTTAEETYRTAQNMIAEAKKRVPTFQNDQAIIDPGIAPVGSDTEGQLKRVLESMRMIHADPQLAGLHMSVGLSNFTTMLPSKRADGSPVKGPLESAFITMAMPLGLDMIIGSMSRKYELLSAEHPALVCLKHVLAADGFDCLMQVQEFYS